ncbi:hypothetical protein [Haloferula sargassicola]|uniref:Concanavalin A-like lectin/glucanases superfamily protein n=1 Tax=Haloferula sargassicola TaxID=490096 RepID=A0ABP9ULB3_9BACT
MTKSLLFPAALPLLVFAVRSQAADVTMNAGDGFGSTSFNAAGQWNNGAAPTAANQYFNGGFLLRTPADGNSYTFAGASLTITGPGTFAAAANEALMWKGTGTTAVITVPNLIVNGGQVRHGQGSGDSFTLAGNISVGANGAGFAAQGGFNVAAPIAGTSRIVVLANGSGEAARMVTFSSSASTFTGDLDLNAANSLATLADDAVFHFVAGASGDSNQIVGTGSIVLNGDFVIDLSGAAATAGSSWPLVTVTTRTFGETFTVQGFTASGTAGSRIWSKEANGVNYQFSEASGVLAVIDNDSDGDGLDDAFEQVIIDFDSGDAYAALADVLPGDDFDGDGSTNLQEFLAGSDPTDFYSTAADTDGDGMTDTWEVQYFGDLSHDGTADADANGGPDGLTDYDEFLEGTDPTDSDTDDDGLNDGDEISGDLNVDFFNEPTVPLLADTDGDGLTDGEEISGSLNAGFGGAATDPNQQDSDFDEETDASELAFGSNPNDAASLPAKAAIIAPGLRNGGFESVNGVPGTLGETYNDLGWDNATHNVDSWTDWLNTTANTGGLRPAQPDHNGFGLNVAEFEDLTNDATKNMTSYVVQLNDVIEVTWFHTQDDTGNSSLTLLVDDGFGGVTNTGITKASALPSATVPNSLVYTAVTGSPLIGRKLGIGVTGDGGHKIDNVILSLKDRDADSDGLSDFAEDRYWGNNDGNPDAAELLVTTGGADWDSDTYTNAQEVSGGSDPTDAGSVPADSDGDGLDDLWEDQYFGNNDGIVDASDLVQDGNGDPDRDFATNEAEESAGTAPDDASDWPDADGDGMSDAWEAANGVSDAGADDDSDGSTNLEEHDAGSDPNDPAWSATKAVLRHRWSFSGSLADSVGGSDAQAIDPDANAATGGGFTQDSASVTLGGGVKAESHYVLLGNNLLSGLQADRISPVTIELWATPHAVQNWSRIVAFGTDNGAPAGNQAFSMSWSFGTDANSDRVLWNGEQQSDGSNAPYLLDVPYHVVLSVTPAYYAGTASGAVVKWYASPAVAGHPLFAAKGQFETGADLTDLQDAVAYLGRSMWGDNTASASWDEVRIWAGELTETERELFQILGPDSMDRSDSEPDGFPDAWEMAYFGNLTTATVGADSDGDGANDEVELAAESSPNDIDSVPADVDGDGLDDEFFELVYFRNLFQSGTDDPDGDLCDNEYEETGDALGSSDPTDPLLMPDVDNDGLPDGWEFRYFGAGNLSPTDLDDGDADNRDNYAEFLAGTNPTLADTDADGLDDDEEETAGTNPLDPDSDDDGLTDGQEVNTYLTDPLLADSDGDLFGDKYEIDHGSDPKNAASVPSQPTGFALLEDFDGPGMTPGQTFNGINGWSVDAANVVVANPAGADRSGHWVNGAMRRSLTASGLQVLHGNTGTLFMQVYIEDADPQLIDHSLSFSDTTGTGTGDHEAQTGMISGNLTVRNGATNYDSGYDFVQGAWYNLWLVADNQNDITRVFVESPAGQTGQVEITAGQTCTFRNGTAANALIQLLFLEFDTGSVLIDNLYVDPTARNLANPLGSSSDGDGDGLDDAWETAYFGGTSATNGGPAEDFDGDGTDNLTEFRLGLIPDDAASRFAIAVTDTNGPAGGFSLQWPSKEGVTFTIRRSANLSTWTDIATGVLAATGGASTSYSDAAAPAGKAFYQVELE